MSKYFKYDTDPMLACPCCGEKGMDESFLNLLDLIRSAVKQPLIVTSGYRCPAHNSKVSTTGINGPHTTGKAIDLKANSSLRYLLTMYAQDYGIERIGIANTFIHLDGLDQEDGFDQCVMWTY